jgi:hypothetical protein
VDIKKLTCTSTGYREKPSFSRLLVGFPEGSCLWNNWLNERLEANIDRQPTQHHQRVPAHNRVKIPGRDLDGTTFQPRSVLHSSLTQWVTNV